jgi:tRNA A-37 threonylcarbamoyl transferase component Bud32
MWFLQKNGSELDGAPNLLSDPAALMRDPPGEVVADEPGRQVRRIHLGESARCVYFKCEREPRPLKQLGTLFRLGLPRTAAGREAALARRLTAAGIPVAPVLAFGERRVMGVPVEGYIITEAIDGPDMTRALAEFDAPARRRIWRQAGELIGRLHARGFFQVVRTKDLIVSERDGVGLTQPWRRGGLVMIDREATGPWAKMFTRGRCLWSLARSRGKFDRAGMKMSTRELAEFLRGYRTTIQPRWRVTSRELITGVAPYLQRIYRHPRYRGMVGMFIFAAAY